MVNLGTLIMSVSFGCVDHAEMHVMICKILMVEYINWEYYIARGERFVFNNFSMFWMWMLGTCANFSKCFLLFSDVTIGAFMSNNVILLR